MMRCVHSTLQYQTNTFAQCDEIESVELQLVLLLLELSFYFFFETANIVRHRKEAAMKGLPVFLREDPNLLFKQCLVSINGH